jgi:polar amino acid transport system substrate-binding protein
VRYLQINPSFLSRDFLLRILSVWYFIIAFSFSANTFSETLKLTTVDWQPFYGQDLPEKGFFSVIARETFKRAGYEIKIEFQPWKRALELTKKGDYDGLLGAYYKEERAEHFIYSDKVFENKDVFVSKNKNLVLYEELSELKAHQIGSGRGYAYSDELKETGFNIVETNDDLHSLRMLLKDRVDLVLISEAHFKYLLEHDLDLYAKKEELFVLNKPFRINSLYCPILKKRPNSEEIVLRFNDALSEIKEDGTLNKILTRFKLSGDES